MQSIRAIEKAFKKALIDWKKSRPSKIATLFLDRLIRTGFE